MNKIANFTKESLRNGALVSGGHRVKYVSDDKEFIILATRFGVYQGFYLTYEKDGAYIDTDRTPAPSEKVAFQTLGECKKFYKVGEYAETVNEKEVEPTTETTATKEEGLSPIMKQFYDLKAKHPDAILLFRCGDFYEAYEEDAKKVANTVGITLTKRNNNPKDVGYMAGFPFHALDTYLPKLVRAGFRIAICDQLEDPKLTKRLVKRGITEELKAEAVDKEVKMEVADATVKELTLNESTRTQDGMRKIVTDTCHSLNLQLDHVSIWQHNGNGDYGLAVAFNGKKPVAVCQWDRTFADRGKTYTFVTDKDDKYTALRKRI